MHPVRSGPITSQCPVRVPERVMSHYNALGVSTGARMCVMFRRRAENIGDSGHRYSFIANTSLMVGNESILLF